ncbi:FAD/NAD(P)-binding domain-containing protein [Myriangium duriaei CBS 260.36]|uniref:FAD/NAD(P)-binding domain-containing protein n=1 Tax=Myriangium duriaei CBS 260.36 TaxID=1168546 RepID=A0A9P4JCR7_9PEZI|nr:FAD/NAD(P)-binding domain-containing protein [Myriangium duriaei CBS 260.36]
MNMLRATMNATTKRLHVGIVGAGFAGLRCADVLLQHGHKVTIFEGRDRVGGRVAQSDALGHKVDLGPNWIHGTDDNPILELARKTGTRLHAWDESQQIYDVDSTLLSSEDAELYGRLLWDDGLIADAFRHSNEHKDTISPDESLWDFFTAKSKELFKDLTPDDAARRRSTLLHVAKMWGAYVGSPIERQSLKFYWLEECIEGENPFVAETYHKILHQVAEEAVAKADLRLNTRVKNVTHGQGNKQPSIQTSGADEHTFDEVVVTTPLGFLKRHGDAFLPGLKPRIAQAIDNLSYGCLDKVYFTFPSAFWNGTSSKPQSNKSTHLDAHSTTPNVTSKSMPLHQSTTSSPHPAYPGFTQWLSPTYAPSNSERWDFQGMNLAALPDSLSHPTLLFYIYGPCSQHVAQLAASMTSPSEQAAVLTDFFSPYLSLLPNYSASDPACTPTAVLATAWAADELAGYGSYSNFQVGLKEGDKDIEALREGMPDDGLWFAGEHTAPFVALGTTTGAYWSGQRIAERIVAKHSEQQS